MSRNEQAYPSECVEAEQLVRFSNHENYQRFLAWRPQDSLHKQALDNLVSFLQEALSQGR
jgi:hypothetical protein